jgi:AcrR family transcriptional regulator
MPLAKRINLARTSFYWFFKDREALLEGLIDLWRENNTGCIAKQASAYAESATEGSSTLWIAGSIPNCLIRNSNTPCAAGRYNRRESLPIFSAQIRPGSQL